MKKHKLFEKDSARIRKSIDCPDEMCHVGKLEE